MRVADDSVAFRFVVEGTGMRVPGAATAFRLPAARSGGRTASRSSRLAGELGFEYQVA